MVWGLALAGVVAKTSFTGRYEALYVAMGWAGVVAVRPLVAALPPDGVAWLAGGGVAYTGGVAFYLWEKLPYAHALWHLAVLAGAACHFLAVRALVS